MKSALATFAALAFGSVACVLAGVYLLFGLGWALIAAAVPMGVVAAVLGRGLMALSPTVARVLSGGRLGR